MDAEIERRIKECLKKGGIRLDLSNMGLTSVPDYLLDSIQELDLSENLLTSLPDYLSNSLQELDCSDNQLTSLPDYLPDSLQRLYCFENQLTILPSKLYKKSISCENKMELFKRGATIEIIRWYRIRKKTRRLMMTSTLYKTQILPKDICWLISGYV